MEAIRKWLKIIVLFFVSLFTSPFTSKYEGRLIEILKGGK